MHRCSALPSAWHLSMAVIPSDASPGTSLLAVEAVRGKCDEPLAAGIVGPRTKVERIV